MTATQESSMRVHREVVRVAVVSLALTVTGLVSPSPAEAQTAGSVRCESDGGSYERCATGSTWRAARLVQQLSTTACIQGKNWGFERNAIWVRDGCRGIFGATSALAGAGERVTCSSEGNRRTECLADTRNGVRLARQLSSVSCVEGSTWGTDEDAIWVDRGCRAEFEIGGGTGAGAEVGTTQRIICGSPTGREATCRTNRNATSVRVLRDMSGGICRERQNWGYADTVIWANGGCRAEFEVSYAAAATGGGSSETLSQRVTCGSSTGQRVNCSTQGSIVSARLVRGLSVTRCRQNLTWGFDSEALWVEGGCTGEFELSVRPGESVGDEENAENTREILCNSLTGQQVTCLTRGQATAVRLVTDLSSGRCVQGKTWGFTSNFVWVNGSCRGRFAVTYRDGGTPRE